MTYTKEFKEFWQLYPGRTNKVGRIIKQDKLGAFVEWRKLTKEERQLAMSKHPKQGKYTPDARKWLRHKRWEDEDVTDVLVEARKRALAQKRRDTEWEQNASYIEVQTPEKIREYIARCPHLRWIAEELRPDVFEKEKV